MQIRTTYLLPILLIAAGCESDGAFSEREIEAQDQALTTPTSGVWIETGSLLTGLSTSTYRDVATSSTNYYVLTNTGVRRVAHSNYASIPSASNLKNISLNCIDYVNSTWNLVGARNKSGSTPAQLVLKIENSSPTTVNLPSDVTTVYDIEAKPYSSSSLEIWVTTNLSSSTVTREFRYNGSSLSAVQQIPQESGSKTGITAQSSTFLIGMKGNSGYPAFFKKYTASPYKSLVENQRIEIDHGPVSIPGEGDYSPGTTSIIYSHGYDGTQMGMLLYPDKIDWASYSNGSSYYLMLNPTGSGTYDLVELTDSAVVFDKTPAREFSYWNDRGYVEGSNNCYNYACNRNTMNFAQPGYGSGQTTPTFKPSDLTAAAVRDGLESVANPGAGHFPSVPEGKSLVALITGLKPSYTSDYHWFRRDRDGKWTAKPGDCEATDLMYPYDDPSKPIVDPRTSAGWDTTVYDTFVGFFLVDSNHEQGMGMENVKGWKVMMEQLEGCDTASGASASTSALSAAETASSSAPLLVTVRMYSGRENPKFIVKDAATIDQIRMAYSQAQTLAGPVAGPKVGRSYMGLSIKNPCRLSGLPPIFTLFNGQLTVESTAVGPTPQGPSSAAAVAQPAATEYLKESTGSLETYLLDQAEARSVIDPATRDRIRSLNDK